MLWATHKQKGFTIVELLIVVVVIAILAAITIVGYNGISQRARAATAQTAAQQAAKKAATYYIENGDVYPSDLASLGIVNTEGTTYQYSVNTSTTPQGYCITTTNGSASYYIGSNYSYTGSSAGTLNQPSPAEGACPGHSATGSAIVNIVTNPGAEVSQLGYGQPGDSNVTLTSARAHQGVQSAIVTMAMNKSSGLTGMSFYTDGAFTSLKPNTAYVASAYVYVPAASGEVRLSVQGPGYQTGNPANVESYSGSPRDQWVRIVRPFTTQADDGDNSVSAYILNRNATDNVEADQFWADSFMITEGTTLHPYADGNAAGWIWSGTAGLSKSSGPAL